MITDAARGLAGGALIGIAAALVWLVHGRIAGISGIVGRALDRDGGGDFRGAFLAGLAGTGAVLALVAPSSIGTPSRGLVGLAVAGLLVGVGTTLSNGCTSGHGVCGIARLSKRSFVAVGTFMLVAGIVVALAGAR